MPIGRLFDDGDGSLMTTLALHASVPFRCGRGPEMPKLIISRAGERDRPTACGILTSLRRDPRSVRRVGSLEHKLQLLEQIPSLDFPAPLPETLLMVEQRFDAPRVPDVAAAVRNALEESRL